MDKAQNMGIYEFLTALTFKKELIDLENNIPNG